MLSNINCVNNINKKCYIYSNLIDLNIKHKDTYNKLFLKKYDTYKNSIIDNILFKDLSLFDKEVCTTKEDIKSYSFISMFIKFIYKWAFTTLLLNNDVKHNTNTTKNIPIEISQEWKNILLDRLYVSIELEKALKKNKEYIYYSNTCIDFRTSLLYKKIVFLDVLKTLFKLVYILNILVFIAFIIITYIYISNFLFNKTSYFFITINFLLLTTLLYTYYKGSYIFYLFPLVLLITYLKKEYNIYLINSTLLNTLLFNNLYKKVLFLFIILTLYIFIITKLNQTNAKRLLKIIPRVLSIIYNILAYITVIFFKNIIIIMYCINKISYLYTLISLILLSFILPFILSADCKRMYS